jgi:hypothetical protein
MSASADLKFGLPSDALRKRFHVCFERQIKGAT